MRRILIVDDDRMMAAGLEQMLEGDGYQPLLARSGEAALQAAIEHSPALILLDIMLPGLNGFEVCRELRKRAVDVPIIMLTAREAEVDKVVGLEIGADDYVTKPFGKRELLARIAAALRRASATSSERIATYRFGSVFVDFERMSATRDGKPLPLTAREFEILRALIQFRGSVVSRERLLNIALNYEADCTTRTVDAHIVRLRKKIEREPRRPEHILTIYAAGYKFVD